jgi:hypothetical protein
MLETMFQKSAMYQRGNTGDYGAITTFWTMTIDPKGVGALSTYEPSKHRWVTKEIFAPVDPDEELMWDEEE